MLKYLDYDKLLIINKVFIIDTYMFLKTFQPFVDSSVICCGFHIYYDRKRTRKSLYYLCFIFRDLKVLILKKQ